MKHYDVIVLGLGGMGSAALCELARRGMKTIGIEQFDIGHDRGSSHGATRIIRKSYFEHSDYVPLLQRAYDLWGRLEKESGRHLFERTGLLIAGSPAGEVVQGIRRSAALHDLSVEDVDGNAFSRRFPGFVLPADMEATFEPDAGLLHVERCVNCHCEQAQRLGASVLLGQPVRRWSVQQESVIVETAHESFEAGCLIVCAGPWSARLLTDLGLVLEIRRKVVFWHHTSEAMYSTAGGCPVFAYDTPQGFFYGFPVIDDAGLKAALHTGGDVVADPDSVGRDVSADDRAPVEGFLAAYLTSVTPRAHLSAVCMYTMTPDEHFVIDVHPNFPQVAFACGFSGHGFKFAPVVASSLADLVTTGETAEPISFLSLSRFAQQG